MDDQEMDHWVNMLAVQVWDFNENLDNPHKRARLVVQVFVIITTEGSKTETGELKLKGKHSEKPQKSTKKTKYKYVSKWEKKRLTPKVFFFHFYICIPTQLYT